MRSNLELLRLQQRIEKVTKKQNRGETADDVVHKCSSLKPLARLGERPAADKEEKASEDVEKVSHGFLWRDAIHGPQNHGKAAILKEG